MTDYNDNPWQCDKCADKDKVIADLKSQLAAAHLAHAETANDLDMVMKERDELAAAARELVVSARTLTYLPTYSTIGNISESGNEALCRDQFEEVLDKLEKLLGDK